MIVGLIQCKTVSDCENDSEVSYYGPVGTGKTLLGDEKFQKQYQDPGEILKAKDFTDVTITTKLSDTTYTYLSVGLERCSSVMASSEEEERTITQTLLGNRLDKLPQRDIFGDLQGSPQEVNDYLDSIFRGGKSVEEYSNMFSEQKEALDLLRSVPGGVCILDGCAGSGKSYVLCCIIAALLLRENKEGKHDQIVIPLAMNGTCDAMARRLIWFVHRTGERLGLTRRPMILRGHKINSEQESVKHQVEAVQRGRTTSAPGLFRFRIEDSLVDAIGK